MPAAKRDPVSLSLDRGARRLLERAYAAPRGTWIGTRLADPSPSHVAYFRDDYGIDVLGPDNAPTQSGTRMRTGNRWARGFTRALYFQHRWYSQIRAGRHGWWRAERRTVPRESGALEVEWGRRLPAVGVIPAGRAVRVRIRPGGRTAVRAVQRLPDRDRTFDSAGNPAGRASMIAGRDWA